MMTSQQLIDLPVGAIIYWRDGWSGNYLIKQGREDSLILWISELGERVTSTLGDPARQHGNLEVIP